ncbi:MAG: hypothetical protein AB8G15_23115 [Saprospiraceae bacterium]
MGIWDTVKQFFETKDELIGTWQTRHDAETQALWRCSLNFNEDGTGKIVSWDLETVVEAPAHQDLFLWNRVDKSTILIKLEQESGWTKIAYQVDLQKDTSSQNWFQLKDATATKKGFWNIPVALYRPE